MNDTRTTSAGVEDTPEPSATDVDAMHVLVSSYMISAAIHAAVELGVADRLRDGPRTAAELAAVVEVQPEALYRLLRALAGIGVLVERPGRLFALTALGATLRGDVRHSVRALVQMSGAEWHQRCWWHLHDSVRSGAPAFLQLFGQDLFSYMRQQPRVWETFNGTMTNLSVVVNAAVAERYDFSPFRRVIDVGGGHGSLIAEILRRSPPSVRGVLFDLPEVVRGAAPLMAELGVADRCELADGDFRQSVPAGGDVYLLKRFLHGFDDELAVAALRRVRDAAAPGARVLAIEMLVKAPNGAPRGKLDDLEMMLLTRVGRERTADEFAALFTRAGLQPARTIELPLDMAIVEGVRAD